MKFIKQLDESFSLEQADGNYLSHIASPATLEVIVAIEHRRSMPELLDLIHGTEETELV